MQAFHPEPGIWYVNHVGQLLQVRVVLLVEKVARRVLIEYINGRQESLKMDEWSSMNLTLHSLETGTYQAQDSHNILVE